MSTYESHPKPSTVIDTSGRRWKRHGNEYVTGSGSRTPLTEIDAARTDTDVDALRWLFATHRYSEARRRIAEFAADGRVTYVPAGALDNPTAMVRLDGHDVAQASVAGSVEPIHDGSQFAIRPMRPKVSL